MTPTLHPDFRALIDSLTRHGARFLVVGAHALAVVARPRLTDDLDLLVEPSATNATAVANALRDFGFTHLADAAREHLVIEDRMLTIGRPPLQVDFLTSISGVSFDTAWNVPFLGLKELIATKRAAGRDKDLRDLALLEELGLLQAKPRKTRTVKKSKKR